MLEDLNTPLSSCKQPITTTHPGILPSFLQPESSLSKSGYQNSKSSIDGLRDFVGLEEIDGFMDGNIDGNEEGRPEG